MNITEIVLPSYSIRFLVTTWTWLTPVTADPCHSFFRPMLPLPPSLSLWGERSEVGEEGEKCCQALIRKYLIPATSLRQTLRLGNPGEESERGEVPPYQPVPKVKTRWIRIQIAWMRHSVWSAGSMWSMGTAWSAWTRSRQTEMALYSILPSKVGYDFSQFKNKREPLCIALFLWATHSASFSPVTDLMC